jgi:hypothetical protein
MPSEETFATSLLLVEYTTLVGEIFGMAVVKARSHQEPMTAFEWNSHAGWEDLEARDHRQPCHPLAP